MVLSAQSRSDIVVAAETSSKQIRVLHLVDSLRVGGKERQVVELLKGFNSICTVQSLVVAMGKESFYVSDIESLRVPLVYLLRRFRWDISVFWRLFFVLRSFRPHIIHTNSDMAAFYAWPLCRLLGIKLVDSTIRNAFSGNGVRWRFHKMMLRLADARVANSRAGFASRGYRNDEPGNYVIYNGFDPQRFNGSSNSPTTNPGFNPAGRKVIGMVAEFSDYKDYPTFIQAAQHVLSRRKDVMFVTVGGGKNLDACKQMIRDHENAFHFLGERKDVENLIRQMDIGVLCTFTEGISNSVMEYMAAGKPVVATDGGGTSELIANGKQGFLVPPKDPLSVAEKIELLLNDAAKAKLMGAAGRRKLEENFSLNQLVENHLQMYREVLHMAD